MTQIQKIIKGAATAFAIFLAVVIISSIVGAIVIACNVTSWFGAKNQNVGTKITSEGYVTGITEYSNVTGLDVSAGVYDVTIQEGDTSSVELIDVSEEYIVKQTNDGVLKLDDGDGHIFNGLSWLMDWLEGKETTPFGGEIIVTVDSASALKECKIEAGTGTLRINDVDMETLKVESGTGSVNIENIEAEVAKFEAGTGSIDMVNVAFWDTKVEAGTGSVMVNGILQGKTKVESGTGAVILDLEQDYDTFAFDIEKGLGAVIVNGQSYNDFQMKDSSKPNSLEIEGGVGSVEVKFAE